MRRFVATDWHTCYECGDDIEPGEVHFAHAVAYLYVTDDADEHGDHHAITKSLKWDLCEACQDTAQWLQRQGYLWNPGDLSKAWAKAWGKGR
jgi:hypothetical protein